MESFIDSHAHLADQAFDGDREQVIAHARDAGAAAIICIGASIEQARHSARIAQAYPGFVAFTAGVHPHDVDAFHEASDAPALESLLAAGAVAVGECGLDYHYDNSLRERQRELFEFQIDLARRFGLPVVVHTRDAEDDTARMIALAFDHGVIGVLHCFTGSLQLAQIALDSGWYVSFSGIVTFRSWSGDDVIRAIPDDRILVESDAPYLAPVPNRGKRNESAWVALTAARIAAVREVSADAICKATRRNAAALFRL